LKDAPAYHAFGLIYHSGKEKRDYEKALYWYKLAAAESIANAMHNIGVLYYDGAITN
jgi:TPR repeat protein